MLLERKTILSWPFRLYLDLKPRSDLLGVTLSMIGDQRKPPEGRFDRVKWPAHDVAGGRGGPLLKVQRIRL